MKIEIEPETKAVINLSLTPEEATFVKNVAKYYHKNPGADSEESRAAAERLVKRLSNISARITDSSELFK